ncbi:hypothetical protein PIB19_15665 [Sphingomonas sp. 7/4-4]|uniref:hypothetical protein n=1 Tax=Sphingomonas sp. 7/4-4 TaxID=3018446 RepID=UPI0022F3912E|nr:hypothetical protein [Sphingomonas sp. 7/4-4]WBY09985.1 hypothetical protein PIB19_15665 [Sphingomonas sp. 7/4-4]
MISGWPSLWPISGALSRIVGVSAAMRIASPRLTARVSSAVAIQMPPWLAWSAG